MAIAATDNEVSQEAAGVLGRLLRRVIDNVQVTINNVHIRLEVSGAPAPYRRTAHQSVALGVTMSSLQWQTTNNNWNAVFVDSSDTSAESVQLQHRLGQIRGFSAYCESVQPDQLLTNLVADATNANGPTLCTAFDNLSRNHEYLLTPVNSQVKLAVGQYPHPRHKAIITFGAIHLALSQRQAENLVGAAQNILKGYQGSVFAAYRPDTSLAVCGTPHIARQVIAKRWWTYAFQWARWQPPRDGVRCIADPERCTWRRLCLLVCCRYSILVITFGF